jgi:hypothetical protein
VADVDPHPEIPGQTFPADRRSQKEKRQKKPHNLIDHAVKFLFDNVLVNSFSQGSRVSMILKSMFHFYSMRFSIVKPEHLLAEDILQCLCTIHYLFLAGSMDRSSFYRPSKSVTWSG